jgi:3-hydroxyacyl-[acyl-carrier-protein] dehydratase
MGINNYFNILNSEISEGKGQFSLELNPDCEVYKGHFPEKPISPGVCNIYMIKSCTEKVVGKNLLLNNLKQCRLTALVTPTEHPLLELSISTTAIDENNYKVEAKLYKDETTFMELKAEMQCLK